MTRDTGTIGNRINLVLINSSGLCLEKKNLGITQGSLAVGRRIEDAHADEKSPQAVAKLDFVKKEGPGGWLATQGLAWKNHTGLDGLENAIRPLDLCQDRTRLPTRLNSSIKDSHNLLYVLFCLNKLLVKRQNDFDDKCGFIFHLSTKNVTTVTLQLLNCVLLVGVYAGIYNRLDYIRYGQRRSRVF